MKNIRIQSFLIGTILLISINSNAQNENGSPEKSIDFTTYLGLVTERNLGYASEKFTVNISDANISNASLRPDPELTFQGSDNGQRRMQMGYEFEASLDWTLELGGKRKARMELARSESELSKSLLEDYFRTLRADATLQYLQALRDKLLYETQMEAYNNMQKIARADSLRYEFGEISKVTASQSRLEARTIYNEALDAESQWENSLLNLEHLINNKPSDTLLRPSGDLKLPNRDFILEDLIITAQNNRSDFLAALQTKNVADRLIALEKANRRIDLGLSVGVGYASYVSNIIAPTPSHTPVSLGITIPIKFSNRSNSDLKIAEFELEQMGHSYSQIENQIAIEVSQAFRSYNTAKKQMQQYDDGILEEALEILDGITYSYTRGENSLLEVLDAQRTYNEVRQTYYETLFNTAAALIELEKAAGIWDISF